MRCAVVGFVVCASGCNAVFGLAPTTVQDATVVGLDAPDARPLTTIGITKLALDTNVDGSPSIDRTSPLEVDPMVQIGLLGQPLEARPYTNGAIEVPIDYPSHDWRLVATLDGVVHEYQWTIGAGHITSPLHIGNPAPSPVPAGSRYAITPAGLATDHQYRNVEFFTSGVWTDSHLITPLAPMTSTFQFDMTSVASQSEPLLGPLGAPQTARNDWQLLVELPSPPPSCRAAIGAAFQKVDLVPGAPTPSAPLWRTQTMTPPVVTVTDGIFNRLVAVLQDRYQSANGSLSSFGYVPKGSLPAFDRPKRNVALDVAVNRPLMVNLIECNTLTPTLPAVVDIGELATSMSAANYAQVTSSRTIGMGPSVTSSIQAISLDAHLEFAAPLTKSIIFDGKSLETDVIGQPGSPDYNEKTIDVSTSRLIDLTFSTEALTTTMVAPDDYIVTLYNVVGLSLVPVRIFHVTAGVVHVDTAAFAGLASRNFIFEITSRHGVPKAAMGDFSELTYPYSAATVWTYAFSVVP